MDKMELIDIREEIGWLNVQIGMYQRDGFEIHKDWIVKYEIRRDKLIDKLIEEIEKMYTPVL